jgi:hypothetical protein
MEVSNQHHVPAALYPQGMDPLVPTGEEAGWAPELMWTQRPEEKSPVEGRRVVKENLLLMPHACLCLKIFS